MRPITHIEVIIQGIGTVATAAQGRLTINEGVGLDGPIDILLDTPQFPALPPHIPPHRFAPDHTIYKIRFIDSADNFLKEWDHFFCVSLTGSDVLLSMLMFSTRPEPQR